MSIQKLNTLSLHKIIQSLSRLDPASAVRFSAVSTGMRNNSQQTLNRLAALKRTVRRRVARIRHFSPGGRLDDNLFEQKTEAIKRGTLSTEKRRAKIKRHLNRAAQIAYMRYQTAQHGNRNSAWNRFASTWTKSGGNRNITRNKAREMFRNL